MLNDILLYHSNSFLSSSGWGCYEKYFMFYNQALWWNFPERVS